MKFNSIAPEIISRFNMILGEQFVLSDEENRKEYGHDETEDLNFPPEVVLKPKTAEEISSILKICSKEHIPVTPIGGRTGLSGGALSVHGGVGLSLERLNRIIEIDEKNLQATVEPGVITQVFQEAVIEKGLFYPPDPSSMGSCFLGGNLAENAGGPKAVKYGVTRDYVLNMEVVLPDGKIIRTGANVLKNSSGYNLTQLMVGSEGTLGVITKIVFRLIPYPQKNLLLLAPFNSAEKACEAVSAVFRAGITPSAMEFMERDAIDWTLKYVDPPPPAGTPPEGGRNIRAVLDRALDDDIMAHLLIEVDGNDMDTLQKDCEKIAEVMSKYDCGEILFAETASQKEALWKIRRSAGEAVKSNSIYKEEDTVVPRYELPKLLKGVKAIGERHGFKSLCYGHAGDGNLHVNIIKEGMSDDDWNNKLPAGIREIFELCVSLGGTISGEHGIGWVQKPYTGIAFDDTRLGLMKGIKKLFDPRGIMNPGKIFD